jgi:P-type Cu+ transporter
MPFPMNGSHEKKSCCSGYGHSADADVEPSSDAKYFCPMCPGVESDKPSDCPKCGMALERNPMWKPNNKTIFTCPMHPEIEQDHPGDCPKCGMALEPKGMSESDENDEGIRDLTRKFWISAVLTLPVFFIAMAHLFPSVHFRKDITKWIEFILTIPVVFWAGGMFFTKALVSLKTWNLNMFTLIATGVGAAFLYSAVAVLAPGLYPESFKEHGEVGLYFEAAAVITVLVLLGQLLEARARTPHW